MVDSLHAAPEDKSWRSRRSSLGDAQTYSACAYVLQNEAGREMWPCDMGRMARVLLVLDQLHIEPAFARLVSQIYTCNYLIDVSPLHILHTC